MKVFDIAIKDMTQFFRSLFAIVMMFVVPILLTGLFYIMFGNTSDEESFEMPITKVVIVNLDTGKIQFDPAFSNTIPEEYSQNVEVDELDSMGGFLVEMLKSDGLRDIMEVKIVENADDAKSAVDNQIAGVAIIIPENFTDALITSNIATSIEFYQDPTLAVGPLIVKSVLGQFLDTFSSSQITLQVTFEGLSVSDIPIDADTTQIVMGAFFSQEISNEPQNPVALLNIENLEGETVDIETGFNFIGLMMAGMTIFYVFFTGASAAQTIVTEDTKGTLPRLFTTPTSQTTILAGKFLAGVMTIVVQFIVLIGFGWLVFKIEWGSLATLIPVILSTVMAASCFGIFLISWMKTERQAGALIGGGVTILGMLGMLPVFVQGMPNPPAIIGTASRFVPQGWAVQGLRTAMEGGKPSDVITISLILLAWAAAFFVIAVARFRNRFE